MFSIKTFLPAVLVIFLLLAGCEPGNVVSIEHFSPSGEVTSTPVFSVEFSKDLAPATVIDKWSTVQYISFSPYLSGRFKWVTARKLIFSSDSPLEPIQQYTAEITKNVLFQTKYSPQFEKFHFHTSDFDVTKVEFFWKPLPHESYKLSVQANIYFTHPVSPSALREFMEIKRDNNIITDYKFESDNSADVIALNFGEISQKKQEQNFSITIKKGLKTILRKKTLLEERSFRQNLPPITELAIIEVTSGFDGTEGWVEVSTTQKVDEKKIKDYIRFNPKKVFNCSVAENSFRITGDFSEMQSAELLIKKGLPGLYGGVLNNDYSQQVNFLNLAPSLTFGDKKGIYLMRGGQKNIEVNAVNISEFQVEVSQVFKNNILYFLNNYSSDYSYNDYNYNDDEGNEDEYSYSDYGYYTPHYYVSNYGKQLYTEKIVLRKSDNWLQKYNINLNKVFSGQQGKHSNNYKGIYVVNINAEEDDEWKSDSKIISLSDLGIIVKKSDDQLMIFVNTLADAAPAPNVTVSVISSNNQTILSGRTNDEGVISFNNYMEKIEGFTPQLITAERGDDFNYLDFRQTFVETSRYDVGGQFDYVPGFNTFIYSERDIYRPGDKINLNAIIRNDKLKAVSNFPVLIKILTPGGRSFGEFKKNLNEQGSFELGVDIPEFAQTGEYIAEIYSGVNQLIGSYRFSVEDFVPDKIRVNLNLNKNSAVPGDSVIIGIKAEYLFGAPASGLKYQAESQYKHKPFISRNYTDYNFSNSSIKNVRAENNSKDGVLDDNGHAVFTHKIPGNLNGSGIIENNIYVSVFDPTGRTVNRFASVDIYPRDYFIGIKAPGYYFSANDRVTFECVAVDKKDKPISRFKAKASLVRFEWQSVLKQDYNNRFYYDSEEKEIIESEYEIDISGGPKPVSFTPKGSGKYEFRVAKVGSSDYQAKVFYSYDWKSSTSTSFEVNKEGKVEIVTDKKTYEPGEKAKLLFTTPFSGRLLITIERNSVYFYKYIDVEKRSAEIEITLPEDYMPNVYVSALLFRKHSIDKTTPFLVGHGFTSLRVERKANRLPVTITATAKIKPLTRQMITVKTIPKKNIYITLAAVDEGILQIRNYSTPDPYKYMYGKRPLYVNSYDIYKLLLPEIASASSSTGGDGGEDDSEQMKKRTNPVTVKRIKLLSVFSGIMKTSGDGTVRIPLDIPQFNGDIRLMAVAYSGSQFGSAENHIKVMDDIIIEPEIPRVLSAYDSLASTVTLINTTSSRKNLILNLKTEGALQVKSPKSVNVSVNPNSSSRVQFGIKAMDQIGKAKIIYEVSGDAKTKEETEIAIRPLSPLLVESESGNLKANNSLIIKNASGFINSTKKTTLVISKFPAVKFAKQLKYLVGYPHGCIEQTVSKLFPQLYFNDLAKLIAPELYMKRDPVYYVKEGIRKIESMQLYDGSISYWQGESYSNWWGSVYAAHFLLEARKAGYPVSENMLNKLLSYIEKKNKSGGTYSYVRYEHNKRIVTNIVYKEIIYGLYVLSVAGKSDLSAMNYYKARPYLLSSDSKYLLAGAFALSDKWNAYYEIVPAKFTPENPEKETGGNFDSEIRSNAIMLNVLLEVQPSNPQIPYMVKHLAAATGRMYSTQETAFAFIALGKAAAKNSNTDMKVDVIVNGKLLGSFNNNDLTLNMPGLNSGDITLKSKGKGEVYFFRNTEGVKAKQKVKENDSFIKIRRTYYDYRTKSEVKDNFYQGELLICKISLSVFDQPAENLAITDMLPSCFEIENPRISQGAEVQWKPENPLDIQSIDIRDDRLILFTSGKNNTTKEFYYMLRVVSKGVFQLPVIGCDAMYDPEFHSYNGAGIIRVK